MSTGNRKKSKLGAFAILLSLIPIVHVLGGILALVDIIGRRNKVKPTRAIIALVISILWTAYIGKTYFLIGSPAETKQETKAEYTSPSTLTSKELVPLDETGTSFYTAKNIKAIKGHGEFEVAPKKIAYKVETGSDYLVTDGEVNYKENWKIKTGNLTPGYNLLTLTYKGDGMENQTFQYVIYNQNEDGKGNKDIAKADSDGDGLTDEFELKHTFTDPNKKNSDDNGVEDGKEDNDSDGLDNGSEQENKTNPASMDSDSDGINDNEELEKYNTDPTNGDSDKDGVKDGSELTYGMNPSKKDSKDDITYEKTKDFKDGMQVDVAVTADPKAMDSFVVEEINGDWFALSKKNIDGMVGNAMLFHLDEPITKAKVTVTIPDAEYEEGQTYFLHYFNEETMKSEVVPTQKQDGNVITAELEHFSKYFVDYYGHPIDGEDLAHVEHAPTYYDNIGMEEKSGERNSALFESYEEYVRYMFPDSPVFSVNINTADMEDATATGYQNQTGHTWTSFVNTGAKESDDCTRISFSPWRLDSNFRDSTGLVAIGFGGWIGKPKTIIGILGSSWDGTLKFQTGYKNLFTRQLDIDGELTYQSPMNPYEEGVIMPENMSRAFVSMPYVIDNEQFEKIREFNSWYHEQYDINKNNCATYATDLLRYAGIDDLKADYTVPKSVHISNAIVGDAGSPGQLAYYIKETYPEEYVYVVEEVQKDMTIKLWYTSKMAQMMSIRADAEAAEALKIVEQENKKRAGYEEAEEWQYEQPVCAGFCSPVLMKYLGMPMVVYGSTLYDYGTKMETYDNDGDKVRVITIRRPKKTVEKFADEHITTQKYSSMKEWSYEQAGPNTGVIRLIRDIFYIDFYVDTDINNLEDILKYTT